MRLVARLVAFATFCAMLSACAPGHPTYNDTPQTLAYLDGHCGVGGAEHNDEIKYWYGREQADIDLKSSSSDQDSLKLDRLLDECATTSQDAWARDAATLMLVTDSIRENAGCNFGSADYESCHLVNLYEMKTPLEALIKSTPFDDIRTVAKRMNSYYGKEIADGEAIEKHEEACKADHPDPGLHCDDPWEWTAPSPKPEKP
jgi:hypothetical protein